MRLPKLKISKQGAPIVDIENAYIQENSANIIAFCVDLKSKHCEIDGYSDDGISIVANEDGTHLWVGSDKNEPTYISFKDMDGWQIFCATLYKYTLRICLIKIKL